VNYLGEATPCFFENEIRKKKYFFFTFFLKKKVLKKIIFFIFIFKISEKSRH